MRDYLLVLITSIFCMFSSLLGFLYIQDCRDQVKAQYREYTRLYDNELKLKKEVRELRQEVKNCKQEQEVITDCVLNKRWN